MNCNNSVFNNQHYLQVDGTAQEPRMSCSYSDIAKYSYHLKALSYVPAVKCCKRFCDDLLVLRKHSRNYLDNFFNFMNSIDSSKTLQFCISCLPDHVLEVLDVTLSFHVTSKQILVNVFSKHTNGFPYVMSSTCFPWRNTEKGLRKCSFNVRMYL